MSLPRTGRMKSLNFIAASVLLSVSVISCTQHTEQNIQVGGPLFTYSDDKGTAQVVAEVSEWPKKRVQILRGMQDAMGDLPPRAAMSDLNIMFKDSLAYEVYTRYNITFTAAEGEEVPAYLYIPKAPSAKNKKAPAMLALHPTGELGKKLTDGQGKPDRAYAKELAERGYVVIAPDYPSFGDMKDHDFGADRYQSGTMQAIFNHIRCVDLLQSLEQVDDERIGVIGHSLGGHNALFAGAFDKRLKVIVSSCGWTLMDYYDIGEEGTKRYGGRLGPWAQDRYMPLLRDKYQLDAEKIPFDFDEVIAALAPRPFLSLSPVNDANFDVEGVRKGIESAAKVYEFLGAADNLQVRYPDFAHEFPPAIRLEAYRFIDNVLEHSPLRDEIK